MKQQTLTVSTSELNKKYKKRGPFAEVWHRLRRNKAAMIGLFIVGLIIALALVSPLLFDYDTLVIKQNIDERLQKPGAAHWFGTDDKGRDIFARVIYGARTSIFISFAAVAFSFLAGGALGSISGYYSGKIDNIIMRFMDILLAIPGTLFAITIMAALGKSIPNLIIALAVSNIPGFARIVRSSILTVRDVEYIEAARAIGANHPRIIFQHILPNSLAPVIVHTTLNVATAILTIAGLSFLGLGISPPMPEWGQMLAEGRTYLRGHSYMTMFPGLAIMITILALNLLGDGLRDALDPRLK